ncbi:MAG: B12-binding domain-containing radical SAM protein [Candidatus Brocadiia bacterium]
MKILLVRPHIVLKVAQRLRGFLHLEPLSLEIVAGGISRAHEVRILDLASESDPQAAFNAAIRGFRPDVIGFTAYSNQAKTVKDLATRAKKALREVTIIVGGCHATMVPQDFKLPGTIDLVVRGEGGSVISRLVQALDSGQGLPEEDVFLPTESDGFDELAAKMPPELPPWEDVPDPRRDLVERSNYFCVWHGEKREILPTLFPQTAALRTSVGCPHHCRFCVVPYLAHGKYYPRSPEDAVDQIESVPEDHIYFVDDEMFINAKRCERIADLLIERQVNKKYISWARADTICRHPELFARWKEAGLSLLYVGLESMAESDLEDYEKGIDPGTNRRAVQILRGLGIGLHAALMVRPDFSTEDFVRTRQTVYDIAPAEVTFTVFSPPPGTPLWEETCDEFICEDPYSFYDCMHTLVEPELPLKDFYSQFSLLYLFGLRVNPWRLNKVRVPVGDFFRFGYRGMLYGMALRNIYRDYE